MGGRLLAAAREHTRRLATSQKQICGALPCLPSVARPWPAQPATSSAPTVGSCRAASPPSHRSTLSARRPWPSSLSMLRPVTLFSCSFSFSAWVAVVNSGSRRSTPSATSYVRSTYTQPWPPPRGPWHPTAPPPAPLHVHRPAPVLGTPPAAARCRPSVPQAPHAQQQRSRRQGTVLRRGPLTFISRRVSPLHHTTLYPTRPY